MAWWGSIECVCIAKKFPFFPVNFEFSRSSCVIVSNIYIYLLAFFNDLWLAAEIPVMAIFLVRLYRIMVCCLFMLIHC